jgi:MFS family permease
MTPIAGRLSDMYGKKKMLLIIVGIYTLGISVAAISTNFLIFIVARIMQGVGASMFAISFSIIRDKFTPEKLAVAQGIFSSMFSAGAVIGVAMDGTIINNFGMLRFITYKLYKYIYCESRLVTWTVRITL